MSPQNLSFSKLIKACERSLKNLKTDYLDLYQIHWPNPAIPLTETCEALNKLYQEGKIRAIGVSNFGCQDLQKILKENMRIVTNQLPYSLLFRAIEYEILPLCQKKKIGILCYSPLMQGLLTGKFKSAKEVPATRARTRHFSYRRPFTRHGEKGCEKLTFSTVNKLGQVSKKLKLPLGQLAIAWLLHQPGVKSVIVGARSPKQIKENAVATRIKLTPSVLEELNKLGEKPSTFLVGLCGELLVKSKLLENGIPFISKGGGQAGFDIMLKNGKKIEVRTSLLKNEGIYPKDIMFYG